jgi:hypothetical protein
MKKLLMASTLALLVVGLGQAPASANFCIHKPCIEIPIPPFPLVIPNIKITCLKSPCDNGYQSPNPWYTYYPPAAYGPYAHVYYPIYGAPPAVLVPAPVPPPAIAPPPGIRAVPVPPPAAPEGGKGVVPTAATQGTTAKTAKQANGDYATARSAVGPKLNDIAGIQRAPAAPQAPQYPHVYQLQPVVGGAYDFGGATSAAPSYWYGR